MTDIIKISKALADKNRLKILQMLTEGETNVGDIAEKLRVEENLASHHLRVLASLNFLKSSKRGRQVFYSLDEEELVDLLKDLKRNPTFKNILEKTTSK